MQKIILILVLLITTLVFGQENITHKELQIKRVDKAPKIDGVLDDDAWKNANIAGDFVMFRPTSGLKEPNNIKTEVKVAYDDEAIYFGAYLYDDNIANIPMEFQTRDNFGNADFFGVILNPQNDGINQTEFFVMSTGNQNDGKAANGREDFSWNAIWESKVKIVDNGWIVEIKIPYSALRFSNEKVQTWGLNFHRHHRDNRDQYSWNFINREKGSISQYDGIITGIENIKPPVRLSVNPFIFGSINSFADETEFDWSAGMDLKYGLSENFTLDATLIPDFGQVAFDDLTLNLGPFEQQFSDKRAFFTEGTDLFGKGDFFYSRRIGSTPINKNNIITTANETIIENPNKVNMLNAIKISGRTKNGLGIGVFNAITETTKATVKNITDNTTREVVTEPLANYNVLVLDQQFNKKSSVTLINTNVMRNGSEKDANVIGALFDITTKNDKFNFEGGLAMSNVYQSFSDDVKTGYEGVFEFGKVNGKHHYGIETNFITKNYDKNDLGFQRRNNVVNYETYYSYRIIEPKGIFNRYNFNINGSTSYLMTLDETTASYLAKPNLYTGNHLNFNFNATTKKQLSFGFHMNGSIGDQYDYYEPRVEGRFYKNSPSIGFNGWISTSYNKKFALDIRAYHGLRFNENRNYTSLMLSPRYRINDKITVVYSLNHSRGNNQKGTVNSSDVNNIIFGNRDESTWTNSISTKYNFSTKSALGLSFRHFWSPVTYDSQFYKLENDGTLSTNAYTNNHDINYNIWNVDLSYNWEFAPGSQLVALYRNQIFNFDNQSQLTYGDNLTNLFDQDKSNTVSLKLIYYLDYNQVKSWRKS
ncbi:MAG: DUF5916 domain-containing protein [Flavobacteriaceae bacterium]